VGLINYRMSAGGGLSQQAPRLVVSRYSESTEMSITRPPLQIIRHSLSLPRMSTFETAAGVTNDADPRAVALYAWNARVSAAFLVPLHICEVVIRNAASEALEHVYGPRWPWQIGFEQSLPNPRTGYNPQRDLQNTRSRVTTTGKAIPELKFVFWQKLFTSRHDHRLWDTYLRQVFPNTVGSTTVSDLRESIYDDLEQVRTLRNRIAHHEPVFARNLQDDLSKITSLIEYRAKETAKWMIANQQVKSIMMEPRIEPPFLKIATEAYYLWRAREEGHGSAEGDWHLAEARLLGLA
jgi:hypothetical protein